MSDTDKAEFREWVYSWFPTAADLRMNQQIWQTLRNNIVDQFSAYEDSLLAENKKLNDIISQIFTISQYLTKLTTEEE